MARVADRISMSPEALALQPAVREVVPHDPRYSARWHTHDFPSPIARWNFHPEYEVHLITRSSGRFIVGDHIGNFAPGQLVLVGPEVPHHWISDLETNEPIVGRDIVLQFLDQWIRSCMQVMPELTDLQQLLSASARGIEFSGPTATRGAELLAAIGESDGPDRIVNTVALLNVMAGAPAEDRRYLANQWLRIPEDPEAGIIVNKTLDYIFGNIREEVNLATAARIIGMSESAFSRYFKRASGYNFSDMVRKLRIAHACKLLDNTSDSVASISQAVGYRNLSNFNRQFLVETSMTPREWRNRKTRRPVEVGLPGVDHRD